MPPQGGFFVSGGETVELVVGVAYRDEVIAKNRLEPADLLQM